MHFIQQTLSFAPHCDPFLFLFFLKKTAVPIFALITNIVNVIFVVLDVVSVQRLEILGPKTRVIELDRRIVIGQIHPSELGLKV